MTQQHSREKDVVDAVIDAIMAKLPSHMRLCHRQFTAPAPTPPLSLSSVPAPAPSHAPSPAQSPSSFTYPSPAPVAAPSHDSAPSLAPALAVSLSPSTNPLRVPAPDTPRAALRKMLKQFEQRIMSTMNERFDIIENRREILMKKVDELMVFKDIVNVVEEENMEAQSHRESLHATGI